MFPRISSRRLLPLSAWELIGTAAGAVSTPAQLPEDGWLPALVPGTVGSALAAAGTWKLGDATDFDERDWWFRYLLPAELRDATHLSFEGLATLAEVWLDDEKILSSDNMFLGHARALEVAQRTKRHLYLRFASLKAALAARRPRGRWRTRLVDHQQLRFQRTTLLGHIPGWSPPVKPIGPWRPVSLVLPAQPEAIPFEVLDTKRVTHVEGDAGVLRLTLAFRSPAAFANAELQVGTAVGTGVCVGAADGTTQLELEARLPQVELWWPHTHGPQPRYPATLRLYGPQGQVELDFGQVGFRTVEILEPEGGFALAVNGTEVFCRGACWTPLDVVSLQNDPACLQQTLEDVREAGMNMIRLGGTMVYETEAFYAACDAQGILVWHDFMFANMDYPVEDPAFAASIDAEARQVLMALAGHPCLAVLCGNSEIEQQAAMVGQPPELWRNAFFAERLPQVCRVLAPGVPYVPSSPSGGTLPFRTNVGAAHYYGVGAYLQPISDARRAEVSFASECLGFSNVPEESTLEQLLVSGEAVHHHPLWKSRVPRDSGTGWDFEDVRDHYLEQLFRLEARKLRAADPERYLALGRVATGEVMAQVLAEWRRSGSRTHGALIWFLRDLWPGAGWGLIDSTGLPKAAYYFVKRALQPVGLFFTDEGVNGLRVHATNERPTALSGRLRVALYRQETQVGEAFAEVALAPRTQQFFDCEALLGHFVDATYTYRFGPPGADLITAELLGAASEPLGEAFFFPLGLSALQADLGLSASAAPLADGRARLTVRSAKTAQAVAVSGAFRASDNYFHLEPGKEKHVILTANLGPTAPWRGSVRPLNANQATKIEFRAPEPAAPAPAASRSTP